MIKNQTMQFCTFDVVQLKLKFEQENGQAVLAATEYREPNHLLIVQAASNDEAQQYPVSVQLCARTANPNRCAEYVITDWAVG